MDRERELDRWYDAHAANFTRPGLLVNVVRFRRLDRGQAQYAAIYEITGPDPGRAWRETDRHPLLVSRSAPHPALAIEVAATYRRVPPYVPLGARGYPRSIAIALTTCRSIDMLNAVDHLTNERTVAAMESVTTCLASRYRAVDGTPDPPEFLEVYEDDAPPGPTMALAAELPTPATTQFLAGFEQTFAHP